MPEKLVIIGAGGVGREIAAVLKKHPLPGYDLAGFIDDGLSEGTIIKGYPVLGGIQWVLDNATDLAVILAFGNPQLRKKIVQKLQVVSLVYPTLIHPNVSIHDEESVVIGQGCYIADGCILTTDIIVGDYCFLNTSCTLQHDSKVGTYSVLMPGVRITGGATIGSSVYIAPNCFIATNAVINNDAILNESILT